MNKDQILLEQAYNQVKLIESPEIIDNKYDRRDYEFEFFLGDENGTLIKEYIPTIESHAHILRKLKQEDVIDKEYNLILDHVLKAVDKVLGSPSKIDFNYSGIILPKQRDVDATYISFWTEKAYKSNNGMLSNLLLTYTKKRFRGPFKFEVTEVSSRGKSFSEVYVAE